MLAFIAVGPLCGPDAEEITACWNKLSDDAHVVVPLVPAQWAPRYGMLQGRFRITWVVNVVSEYNAA